MIGDQKMYTYEEVFAKALKSPTFRKAHEERIVRYSMAREMRELRKVKKMSQEALAKKADMPQSVIARIESGRHSFSLSTLYRIAKAFGKEVKLV